MTLSTLVEADAPRERFVAPPVLPHPPVERLVRAAAVVIVVLFGGFGAWACLAPLSSAAVAPGVVKVDSNRKTIQHLEGGIVREILVRDGDVVKKGQALVRLDRLDSDADRDATQAKLDALSAQEARLIAERDEKAAVQYPVDLTSRTADRRLQQIMEGQAKIFVDHQRAIADQVGVWQQRVQQYKAQIASLEGQNAAISQQIPLYDAELEDQKTLYSKGLALRPKMLGLERQILASKGDFESNNGKIQSLRDQIAEAEVQINAVRSAQAKSVSEELRDVQDQRIEAVEQLRKYAAKAGRTDIVAPEDGTIVNLKVFAAGAVVPPGGPLLDLVPTQDKMVLEVKIQPLDIDIVRPELPATVRFVAYKQRTTPTVEGKVAWVAADVTTDEKTNSSYFLARVEVSREELGHVPNVKLYPGMPVDVSIVTGERTLLAYLTQPLRDSFEHAFREE